MRVETSTKIFPKLEDMMWDAYNGFHWQDGHYLLLTRGPQYATVFDLSTYVVRSLDCDIRVRPAFFIVKELAL